VITANKLAQRVPRRQLPLPFRPEDEKLCPLLGLSRCGRPALLRGACGPAKTPVDLAGGERNTTMLFEQGVSCTFCRVGPKLGGSALGGVLLVRAEEQSSGLPGRAGSLAPGGGGSGDRPELAPEACGR